ncbi:MAG: helix-turn-helix domain-containing protein [Candidatus Sigynarchaeota archaeon]
MESDSHVSSSLSNERSKSISPIEAQLISVLKEGGPLTRDQLVKKLSIPRTTIYDGLKKLMQRNEVKKYPFYQPERARGRPQVLFSLLDDKK